MPDQITHPTDAAAHLSPAPEDTIGRVFARAVARSPQAVALRFEDRDWTYAQLRDGAHRVARRLQDTGLPAGTRVAAYATNSDAYALLFLACVTAGYVHVPVNFALKGGELAHALEDSGAELLVADAGMLERVDQVRAEGRASALRHVWTMLPAGHAEPSVLQTAQDETLDAAAPEAEVSATDLAQLLYTSGTTSTPKGAMMSHRALVAEYLSSIIALDFTAEDRPLVAMPLYHSAAMHVFLLPYLSLGATVRLLPAPDIPRMLELVETEHIGSLFLAPTVWVPLANHPDLATRDLSSLRKAQYGASIMPVTVLQRLRQSQPGIGFYNCFGQSELGPLCTVLRPEEHDARCTEPSGW